MDDLFVWRSGISWLLYPETFNKYYEDSVAQMTGQAGRKTAILLFRVFNAPLFIVGLFVGFFWTLFAAGLLAGAGAVEQGRKYSRKLSNQDKS